MLKKIVQLRAMVVVDYLRGRTSITAVLVRLMMPRRRSVKRVGSGRLCGSS